MKICAVVIWFNPEKLENVISNVNSYASLMSKVYIIDNSDSDNSALASQMKNAVYISLGKNTGIANALNVGCDSAIKDGFEWCMTMDQDSEWEVSELKKYLAEIEANKNDFQNFSPTLKFDSLYSFTQNLKNLFKKQNQKEFFDFQFDDRWITSGSVMNLSVWEKLGKFNADLFIDEVDFDYCARFSSNGNKNRCCKNVFLNHKLGETKRNLFFNYGVHSDFRLYYQIRNSFYMKKANPNYTQKYKDKYDVKKLFVKEFLLNPLNFIHFIKIFKKAKKGAESLKIYGVN